ncbi:MAG: hypothetical protein Q8P23_01950 [bacterium]|nr:hypothetical protein [bacterium]
MAAVKTKVKTVKAAKKAVKTVKTVKAVKAVKKTVDVVNPVKITGLYWHLYHEDLFEWCNDFADRVAYIRSSKPVYEQALRLALFKPVKNPPAELAKAVRALHRSKETLDVWSLRYNVSNDEKIRAGYDRAIKRFNNAQDVYFEVERSVRDRMVLIHAQECPNCPWDGQTIFSEGWTKHPLVSKKGTAK